MTIKKTFSVEFTEKELEDRIKMAFNGMAFNGIPIVILKGKELEDHIKSYIKTGKQRSSALYGLGCHTCKKNLNNQECDGVPDPSECITKFYSFHENKENLSEEIKESIEKGKKYIKCYKKNQKNNIEIGRFPNMPPICMTDEEIKYED